MSFSSRVISHIAYSAGGPAEQPGILKKRERGVETRFLDYLNENRGGDRVFYVVVIVRALLYGC